ncbi:hypothetical protein EV401DRAFT_1898063 [Pisolithus croceorrhizus]|nr:hypothetical protein EV401DRAFT_1898063 [Pisolithus croceorrhizus]
MSVSTLDFTLWLLPSHADLLTGFMDIDCPSIDSSRTYLNVTLPYYYGGISVSPPLLASAVLVIADRFAIQNYLARRHSEALFSLKF